MKCSICGADYTICSGIDLNDGEFHWQSVACSYRCAREYAERQRTIKPAVKKRVSAKSTKKSLLDAENSEK